MPLPAEAIKQFTDLYERMYGVKLEPAEASARANIFFQYCKAIQLGFPDIPNNNNENKHEQRNKSGTKDYGQKL
jgi:hypothetical protein